MKISARVENQSGRHTVAVATEGRTRSLPLPAKTGAPGSDVNGGELLFLALATCYCNDLYREARKCGIAIRRIEVEVEGEFGREGEGAHNLTYRATAESDAPEEELLALMRHTDTVAEIQNTLRSSTAIGLVECRAIPA